MSNLLVVLSGCGLQAFNPEEPRRPPTEAPVTFSERYRVSVLEIPAESDTDGDGVVDNHLPEGLELLDFAVPESGYGLASFNQRLAEHVTELRPVFFDARVSDILRLEMLSGTTNRNGVVRVDEDEGTTLVGTIDADGLFDAGPADVVLDVVLGDGLDPVPLGLLETRTRGTLDALVLEGTLYTRISIASVVNEVIEPSVPAEGWDVDRDGILETKDEVMGIVANLAELLGDDTLADGSPAISAALAFVASPETD